MNNQRTRQLPLTVALLLGASLATAQEPAFFHNGTAGEYQGSAVAFAGDADGDGYGDYLVGARGAAMFTGKATLYSGADGGVLRVFNGPAPFSEWGFAVDGAGDLDGDGRADVLVASPWTGGPVDSGKGRVVAYSGSTGAVLWQVDGASSNDNLGWAVVGADDLNGDGVPDVLVSVPGYDGLSPFFNVGAVRALSGASGQQLYQVAGGVVDGELGTMLSAAGDLDGDGADDWIAATRASLSSSAAVVVSGATGAQLHSFSGPISAVGWGNGVAGLGDVDSDGVPDLAIGKSNSVGVYSGATFALIRENTAVTPSLLGPDNTLGSAGDLDHDGAADVLVGFLAGNPPCVVALSGATMNAIWPWIGSASSMDDLQDFHAGGYPDLIVGNEMSGGATFPGRAEVHLPFDLHLRATPVPVAAGSSISIATRAGVAGLPAGTFLTAVDGAPTLILAAVGLLDFQGHWTWNAPTTPSAAGHTFTIVNGSPNAALTAARLSNPVTLAVQ